MVKLSVNLHLKKKCIGDDTKGASRWSPNYIRKTKNSFCGPPVSVSLPKFCEKLLPRTKFHWNRSIGCDF